MNEKWLTDDLFGPTVEVCPEMLILLTYEEERVRRVPVETDNGNLCKSWNMALMQIGKGLLVFVDCLTSQQHASVSQGRVCSDNCTCCHTEIEVADETFHLTLSQYTDTGQTSPRADTITKGAWHSNHRRSDFSVSTTQPGEVPTGVSGNRTWICSFQGGRLNHKTNEAVMGKIYFKRTY